MNSSKQASRYSCALQMKLYASIVSLAGLLLYIKRMAKIPPFPCFTTTLIFAIPDSRIHPLRVCRSYATYYSVVIAPGKVNTRFARASFSLERNLFMIRFSVTLYVGLIFLCRLCRELSTEFFSLHIYVSSTILLCSFLLNFSNTIWYAKSIIFNNSSSGKSSKYTVFQYGCCTGGQ